MYYDLCSTCGNGIVEPSEMCDGEKYQDGKKCEDYEGYDGDATKLSCTDNCSKIDPSNCAKLCGNGTINTGEECEGTNLQDGTCGSTTSDAKPFGKLKCDGTCKYNISICKANGYVEVSVGSETAGHVHVCARRKTGGVDCWSKQTGGFSNSTTSFTAIASGTDFSCGIKMDGEIECWPLADLPTSINTLRDSYLDLDITNSNICGRKSSGLIDCTVAQGPSFFLGHYSAITAMGYHACGTDAIGGVTCTSGRLAGTFSKIDGGIAFLCGVSTGHQISCSSAGIGIPAGNYFVDVSAGVTNSVCGLHNDGKVTCVGTDNVSSSIGNPTPLSRFSDISVGQFVGCGVTAADDPIGAGAIRCWGARKPFDTPQFVP